MTTYEDVARIRRMLYPPLPWYRRIRWAAVGGWLLAMACGSAVWYALIWLALKAYGLL